MSAPATSDRTALRDAVVAALSTLKGREHARAKEFDISLSYLTIEECKRFPTYCVIVTDESPEPQTQQKDDCAMSLVLVLYVRDESDVRATLDAAIEDVYEAMLHVQSDLQGRIWKLKLEGITTDEGTTVAKPHAQGIQSWRAHHQRPVMAV